MVLGIINPFSWISNAVSSEKKSYPISCYLLCTSTKTANSLKKTSTKTANSLKVSKTCFSVDEKYTTIIPEIKFFFVCPLVGLMYENSLYDFKDPKFLIQ